VKEKFGGLGELLWCVQGSRRKMLFEILNYSGFIGGDSVS
jgi:hypothetical protein